MIKKEIKVIFASLLIIIVILNCIKLDNCNNKINELERKVNETYVEEDTEESNEKEIDNNSIKVYEYNNTNPKNCPFCGSEAKLLFDEDMYSITGSIECTKCGIRLSEPFYRGSKEELTELLLTKWNSRVE